MLLVSQIRFTDNKFQKAWLMRLCSNLSGVEKKNGLRLSKIIVSVPSLCLNYCLQGDLDALPNLTLG